MFLQVKQDVFFVSDFESGKLSVPTAVGKIIPAYWRWAGLGEQFTGEREIIPALCQEEIEVEMGNPGQKGRVRLDRVEMSISWAPPCTGLTDDTEKASLAETRMGDPLHVHTRVC